MGSQFINTKFFILFYVLFQTLFCKVEMVDYKVSVHTGDILLAGTVNRVYLKLVGTTGMTDRVSLLPLGIIGTSGFIRGSVTSFTVSAPSSIGKLIMIEVDKQPYLWITENNWFLDKMVVIAPDGSSFTFPAYRWIDDSDVHRFREATALKVYEDSSPVGKSSRTQELEDRRNEYKWDVYLEGIPHCLKSDNPLTLPPEVRFSFTKASGFLYTQATLLAELNMKGYSFQKWSWSNIDDISEVFCCKRTDVGDYVQAHWKEDSFFGYQLLNGINPKTIKRCDEIPSNFPVTDSMVFPDGQTTLADEIAKGNLFLLDYSRLDNVNANTINFKKQYLMAPLVLLLLTSDDKLMPVAIQLKQKPGQENPIFLPSDPEYDWLLAKTFVRGADFNEHQLNTHLLRTHLLAEVFTVSLLRNFPMVHPLYKLLIPHTRYTLQINDLARSLLISEFGIFTQFTSSGREGLVTILQRSTADLTYSSLCLPDDIAERGMEDIPNFFYRDDGLKTWDIINRFVKGIIEYYYKNDDEVRRDTELQNWIADIFAHGFLSRESSGIPKTFTTVPQLIKFVTMVIFTTSSQHGAVNSGQYDYDGWMPNTPYSLKLPPPSQKGVANENTLLETFPDIDVTVNGMSVVWLLSKQSSDFIALGDYPMDHFMEDTPRELIAEFQENLKELSATITSRNSNLEVPYNYMNPPEVENSVAI